MRGIEETAERNGDLFCKDQPYFGGQLVLAPDPLFIARRMQREDRFAADRGRGEARHEREERLPFKRDQIGVLDHGRNGIEERHLQQLW